MRHGIRLLIAVPLLAAAVATAAGDPWDFPVPEFAELGMRLGTSKRSYKIELASKPWEGANGPERLELPLAKEEKDGLARACDLVAKGDHDAAAKEIDALLARNPANWDAFLVRAQSLHARNADPDAVLALRTALVGNRRSPDAWNLLDDVAKALGRKVVRPKIEMHGWVRELGKDEVEVGCTCVRDDPEMPWSYYAQARAAYRWEGFFARDFPGAKPYVFTLREQVFALRVLVDAAESDRKEGRTLSADVRRLVAERKAGTLVPFAFFAVYPEPLPPTPERDFDALRPRLQKYFDERILVKR